MKRLIMLYINEEGEFPSKLRCIHIKTNSFITFILKIVNKITKQNFTAITMLKYIHIVDWDMYSTLTSDDILIKHEFIHMVQKHLIKNFYIKYLIEWAKNKFNYNEISFEKQAYRLEGILTNDYSKLYELVKSEIIEDAVKNKINKLD